MSETTPEKKHRSIPARIGRIFLYILGSILLLVVLIVILIQLPPVQNFARKKVQTYMTNKLQTRFEIGHINIGFPKMVVLEDVYIEDRQKDTLLSGGKIRVDINMFKLISGQVQIKDIELEDLTAKVKRQLPDTIFNFQFIVDAFTPKTTTTTPADTSAMQMAINRIELTRIRMLYLDDVTGSDMNAYINSFETVIDRFQPDKMRYHISTVKLDGLDARIYQHKPLATPDPVSTDVAEATEPIPFDFKLGDLDLRNIKLDYGNDVSSFYTNLNIGSLNASPQEISFKKYLIRLDDLNLDNTTASIRLGKSAAAKVVKQEAKEEVQAQAVNPWHFVVNEIRLNNNNIKFDDDNSPRLSNGMDYAHLDAKALTLHVDDLRFAVDSISGSITKGSMKEKSGFVLNTLETNFLYAGKESYLQDLLIQTPGTELKHKAVIRYPSIESLANNIGAMELDVDIEDSKVQVKDILVFAPQLKGSPGFTNSNAVWTLNGRITGKVSEMNISELYLAGLSDTRVSLRGSIAGIPDIKKLRANLAINEIRTSKRDINMLLPKGTLPTNITLPNRIITRGTIVGNMSGARMNLNLQTNLGNAAVNGTVSNPDDPKNIGYDMRVNTQNINLGRIMQNDSLFGMLTAQVYVKGRGTDPKTMSANIRGNIPSFTYNRYTYQDAEITASLRNQVVDGVIGINDPNISLALNARADISGEFPAVKIKGTVDSLRTMPLNFTTQPVFYKGNIDGDFASTNPDDLRGTLLVTQSTLLVGTQSDRVDQVRPIELDTIFLEAGVADTGRFLSLKSDVANIVLTGEYKLTQIGYVFQDAIQPHFALVPEYKKPQLDPYDFSFKGHIINAPLFTVFMPDLKKLEPVELNGKFSSTNGWNTALRSPLIVYGTNTLQNINFNAGTNSSEIKYSLTMDRYSSGSAMNVYNTSVSGIVANNNINFLVDVDDINKKDKYQLGGVFAQPSYGLYTVSLNQNQLMLNYDKWTVAPNNIIRLDAGDINISNFSISRNEQQLSINSASQQKNAPLNINFANFRIATITAFAKQDTLLVDGRINGLVNLRDIATQPAFTSDLMINDLKFYQDTAGNLAIKVSNTTPNVFVADARLTGYGNDLVVAGQYEIKPGNEGLMDLELDLRQLQMKTVEGLSVGSLKNAKGFLNGKVSIEGTMKEPNIDGNIKFNNTSFIVSMLNSYYAINDEQIEVNNEGVHFDSFTIRDSTNNELNIDGYAYTTNYMNYRFDLDITADDFKAVNSTKAANQLFYGSLNFDSKLHVAGTELSPIIDGGLTINENTDFTVVLPQPEPGVQQREGIVRFIDMDSVRMDTTMYTAVLDSLSKTAVTGMEIAVNIEINREAIFNLIIDEGNGDFLRMKGQATLSAGIDASGNMTLSGTYELDEGAYELTFNFLKRRFEIQKGSKITWLGEPTKADVNLTAIYIANTSPLTLVEDYLSAGNVGASEGPGVNTQETSLNRYKQKLPFEVHLKMTGELMKPIINFDIDLPEDKNYNVSNDIIENVDLRLTQLRAEPSELNKQVFALLLLNRFVSENPFESGGGGGFNAGSYARQSVSKILTQELNELASDLISGVDLNFDVASTEDYTTGKMENRTDLNVSLSKQLLNDRLKVSVGSNFELEGPQQSNQRSNNIAGDVALDYMLSKDGRYMLRAYRKNDYEANIEGYVIETGVKFIISLDYNHFRDLFRKKKKTEEKK